MKRLTKRNEDGKAWYNHTTEGEIKNSEILEKLTHYEDLEEKICKHFPNTTIEDFVDITLKYIQGKDDEIRVGRILTNEDALQWDEWKNSQKQGGERSGNGLEL